MKVSAHTASLRLGSPARRRRPGRAGQAGPCSPCRARANGCRPTPPARRTGLPGIDPRPLRRGRQAETEAPVYDRLRGEEGGDHLAPVPGVLEHRGHEAAKDPLAAVARIHADATDRRHRKHGARPSRTRRDRHVPAEDAGVADQAPAVIGDPCPVRLDVRRPVLDGPVPARFKERHCYGPDEVRHLIGPYTAYLCSHAASLSSGAADSIRFIRPVACQNSCRASDLGFYPRHSCSFASSICSWSGCPAGWRSSPAAMFPRTWKSWCSGTRSRSCAARSPARNRTGLTGP